MNRRQKKKRFKKIIWGESSGELERQSAESGHCRE